MPRRYQIQAFQVLLSYRTQRRELRQSNPEIRRSLGFFSFVLPATSRCLASSVPGHVQKQRRILALRAVARCVQQEFSKQHALCLVSHVHFLFTNAVSSATLGLAMALHAAFMRSYGACQATNFTMTFSRIELLFSACMIAVKNEV